MRLCSRAPRMMSWSATATPRLRTSVRHPNRRRPRHNEPAPRRCSPRSHGATDSPPARPSGRMGPCPTRTARPSPSELLPDADPAADPHRRRARRRRRTPSRAGSRLDPRPRRGPPRPQRRGARRGARRRSSRAAGSPMYASQEARDADIADLAGRRPVGDPRAGCSAATTDARPTRSTRCPTTSGTTTIERVPGRPHLHRAATCPGCGCARWRSTTPTSASATPRADWPPAFVVAPARRDAASRRRGRRAFHGAARPTSTAPGRFGDGRARPSPAPAADLGWWLTGRGDGDGLTSDSGDLPQIGAW